MFPWLTAGCHRRWASAARCTGGTLPPGGSRFDASPSPGTFLWDSAGTLSCSRCWSWRRKMTYAPHRGGGRSAHGSVCTFQSAILCVGSTGAAGWCPAEMIEEWISPQYTFPDLLSLTLCKIPTGPRKCAQTTGLLLHTEGQSLDSCV